MADLRQYYHDYNPSADHIRDIQEKLDEFIGAAYDVTNETSLKHTFLAACFKRIDPDQDLHKLVQTWENYDDNWGPQKTNATALRMLMTKQIGWPVHEAIGGFERKYLAGILLAIRACDSGISQSDGHAPVTLPPNFDLKHLSGPLPERTLPKPPLPPKLSFSNTIKADAKTYLEDRGIDPDRGNHHVVYVLDCTPEPGSEGTSINSARRFARAKSRAGLPPSYKEAAATFLNESKGVLYVGYSHRFPQRMEEHHLGISKGAPEFTSLYKPKRLLDVTEYSSKGKGEDAEKLRGDELQRKTDCHVYYGNK